jgi:hypothetical protein
VPFWELDGEVCIVVVGFRDRSLRSRTEISPACIKYK